MMHSLTRGFSWVALHWQTSAVMACAAVGIAVTTTRCLETEQAKLHRAERNRKRKLRRLADRISTYGRNVHQRYPTGDVVVGECDLAEQFRKRPESIVTALNILLGERKVQKAPLNGYWKLNL
jgi:hypothetical protein